MWAWTDPKRLIPTPSVLNDEEGNALLKIATDHDNLIGNRPWKVSFEEEHPTILVNKASDTLREKLESLNEISVLLMPQVCGAVVDELVKEHLTEPVSLDEESWKGRWYKWAFARTGTELPLDNGETTPHELIEECQTWKNNVLDWLNTKLDAAVEVENFLTEAGQ